MWFFGAEQWEKTAMRLAWGAALAATVVCGTGNLASAASISVETKTYAIAGNTGMTLLQSMNKRGPKHGFLSRAIAQTQYQIKWDVKTQARNGTCFLTRATPRMDMTYTYPQPSEKLPPDLRRRWNTFMAGVRKHEQQHGRYAIQMVNVAERSIRGVKTPNDPNCRKTGAYIKKRVAEIYEEYEAKQIVFDHREHRDHGNIHRMVTKLAK